MKKLSIAVSVLWLVLSGCGAAFAAGTPVQTIEALYKPYLKQNTQTPDIMSPMLYTAKIRVLLAKLKKDCKDSNEVCGPDFDFFINAQDYDVKGLKVRQLAATDITAKVEVTFQNLNTNCKMTFDMVKIADDWLIDELTGWSKSSPEGFKLSEILVP